MLPNMHICQAMCNVSSGGTMELDRDGDELSRIDLDSHANIVVVGNHAARTN